MSNLFGSFFICSILMKEVESTLNVNFGSSGSPVLTSEGKLIGVINLKGASCHKFGNFMFCLPGHDYGKYIEIDSVIDFMESYLDRGEQ